jgi:glycosyltransferase involved in cell wall biosynthesis
VKILHISTIDTGGAAISAIRLHLALLGNGIESSILFSKRTNYKVPKSYEYVQNGPKASGKISRLFNKVKRRLIGKKANSELNRVKLENRVDGYETFTFNPTDFDITTQEIYKEADLIHLHSVAGFVDFKFFRRISKPVIWTLHDMNPITGGCHYSGGCIRYKSDCKNCPQLIGTIDNNNSWYDQTYKLECLKEAKPVITSPSVWLMQCSIESKLFKRFRHINIPYSLDLSVFKHLNTRFCRSVLNLPLEKTILLFVSDSVENKRKGFDLLLDALPRLEKSNIQLCAVGSRSIGKIDEPGITYLGRIDDERLLALVYSAADIFILPSREDNLPNCMLESLACGTPVLAYNLGGMTDIIKSGLNGILVTDQTAQSLSYAINQFLSGNYKFDREEISKEAKIQFSPALQAARYRKVYEEMIIS